MKVLLIPVILTLLFLPCTASAELIIDFPDFEQILFRGQVIELQGSLGNNGNEAVAFQFDVDFIAEPDEDPPPPWLFIDPAEGNLQADDQVRLTFTFDASETPVGEYEAELHLVTNDPNQADIVAAFFMTVDQARPRIEFEWLGEMFDPNGNWNEMYPDLFFGGDYPMPAVIRNVGEQLLIVEASIENDAFYVEPNHFEIEGGGEAELTVFFAVQEAGRYEGTLILNSNDPNNEEMRIALIAEASAPPEVGPIDESIEEWLLTGEVIQRTITIDNNGDALLRFTVDIEIRQEGDRDSNARSLRSVGKSATPIRDDRGDLIGQFNAPAQQYKNLAYDPVNELMWVINFNAGTATAYDFDDDYNNLEEVSRINPGGFLDGACFNGILYLPAFNNQLIHRFNENGQNIGAIQMPFVVRGIACDPDEGWLFAQNANDDFIYVFHLNDGGELEGNAIGVIRNHRQFHGNLDSYGLEWVNDHWDGQLWMTSPRSRQVHQIFVDTDDWVCVNDREPFDVFQAQDEPYSAVAHDGRNLWAGGFNNASIRIYDDGRNELHWIMVEPMEGEIEPDAWMDLVVTLDANGLIRGEYVAEIEIETNDPENSLVMISVILIVREQIDPPPWEPEPTDDCHSILVTGMSYNGEPVPEGWWIGAFTPDNVWCGVGVWDGEDVGFPVWGADENHQDYFHEGELMHFLAYDPEEDVEYWMHATVEEGDLHWHVNGLTILSLAEWVDEGQRIALRQGWNLMSFNIILDDEYRGIDGMFSVPLILAQLEHHVLLLKDGSGRFYAPAFGWNGIPFWNLQEGYQIKVDEDVEGFWRGQPIDPQADIPLRRGWNIIPYYPNYQLDASRASGYYVISPIRDHVIIAKDEDGNFMIPSRDFAAMPAWRPGKAYQINVDQAVVLNYPEERQMVDRHNGDDDEVCPVHFVHKDLTGGNMSVLVSTPPYPPLQAEGDIEIGVFTPSGLCVGASVFTSPTVSGEAISFGSQDKIASLRSQRRSATGMAVWGDDPTTPEIDGALEGEKLEFRLWNGTEDMSLSLVWEGDVKHSSLSYATDSFAVGELLRPENRAQPYATILHPPTPNPFNSMTTVRFELTETSRINLSLFDETGRNVRSLAGGEISAGSHTVTIDGEGLAAGIYLVKLETADRVLTQKVVLIK